MFAQSNIFLVIFSLVSIKWIIYVVVFFNKNAALSKYRENKIEITVEVS
jgi:hypothetical protein